MDFCPMCTTLFAIQVLWILSWVVEFGFLCPGGVPTFYPCTELNDEKKLRVI